jgi:hypothetical protein
MLYLAGQMGGNFKRKAKMEAEKLVSAGRNFVGGGTTSIILLWFREKLQKHLQ